MKEIMVLCLTVLFTLLCGCSAQEPAVNVEINGVVYEVSGYSDIEAAFVDLLDTAGFENIKVYDASELTAETLESRKGTTIVERCIGIVTDKQSGDGAVLNLPEDCGYYISYRGIYLPISDGTVILSYMVYNPDNNYIDDIMERYDFILSREWED